MKKVELILFGTLLIICSCQSDKIKVVKEEEFIKPFPKIIDTFSVEKFNFFIDNQDYTWQTIADFRIYYIGKQKDTIYLNPIINIMQPSDKIRYSKFQVKENPFEKYYIDWLVKKKNKNFETSKIEVRVDTATQIANSYPVFIVNKETDTIGIAYGRHLAIILEAIDSSGSWKPIQEKYIEFCGVGVGSYLLPPNECLVTLAPILKGKYRTLLRLTFEKNHSEPFVGFINYRQFQSAFKGNGEYKEEYLLELNKKKSSR